MSEGPEIVKYFNEGVNVETPDVISDVLEFVSIENFILNHGRFLVYKAANSYVTLPSGEVPKTFAFSFRNSTLAVDSFVITDDKVYKIEMSTDNTGTATLIGSFTSLNTNTIFWTTYTTFNEESIYFTKLGTSLQRIRNDTLTEVAATWDDGFSTRKLSARYIISAFDRNVLLNIQTDNGDYYPRRVQWSNIYDYEDFEITEDKEGDFFDIDSTNLEITGAFDYRGYVLFFTRRSIYRMAYLGFPKIFEYQQVFSQFGNIYHKAAISVKDIVFFIGEDNFYTLDGFVPKAIGTEIWKEWLEVNASGGSDEVIAFENSRRREVFWRFVRKGSSKFSDYRSEKHYSLIVYNYFENRWSFRDYDGIECFYSNTIPFESSFSIDTFDQFWDNNGRLTAPVTINDYPWRPIVFSSQSRSSNVVTATCTEDHGLTTGDILDSIIDTTPSDMNGTNVEVTVTGTTTFTYVANGADESASTPGQTNAYTFDGSWQVLNFPDSEVVGQSENLSFYQQGEFTTNESNNLIASFETKESYFNSMMDTKEITQIKLLYKKVGSPIVRLSLGVRENQNDTIEWTNNIEESSITPDEEMRFIFDKGLRGKLFTLKGEVINTPDNYVEEISAISFFGSGLNKKGADA